MTDPHSPDRLTPTFGIQRGEPFWFAMFRMLERHVMGVVALVALPINADLVILCAASYVVRMFAMEGLYHRFFSHRCAAAGRTAQFVLALLGTQCGLRGALWWASKHRDHHRFVDTKDDPHSPGVFGFWYAFILWMRAPGNFDTDLDRVPELARFPEQRWLNKF
ncbi:MAG TPA: hypothetical protein VFC24_13765, partial [Casimicrobiaceae bacterium]|nr:hypothetical protein [Casimicrobiaceae bacterium]